MTVVPSRDRLAPLCIRASAGSGKTYRLSRRYLQLVALGAPIDSILATTFTRLAAGEIRDRILMQLVESVETPGERAGLAETLGRAALTADDVTAWLRGVAEHVDRMQVRTLDGFFGAIARSFALELGLPPAAGILEEEEAIALRMRAIDDVFERVDPAVMSRLLRRLTEGRADRSAWNAVDRVVRELDDLALEAPAVAWSRLEPRSELREFELVAAIRRIEKLDLPKHKTIKKTRAKLVDAARAGRWEDVLDNGLAERIVAGKEKYCRKPITDAMREAIHPLIDHAGAAIHNAMRLRLGAMHDLLDAFHAAYAARKREAGVVTFGDITLALGRRPDHAPLDEIYYRIDARVNHLLLDEFQDTSMLQWRALGPVVEEILSDETRPRSFFVVGDGKQSIYGWRNACPEILASIPERLGVASEPLDQSWRSAPAVIDVVNAVFGKIDGNAALARNDADAVAARAFARDFAPHRVAPPNASLPGLVEIRVADADRDDPRMAKKASRAQARLREAAALARDLHAQAPGAEIAILTRTNGAVGRLLYELGRLGVPASGRGGSPLVDAPPVEVMLDALRFADHPDDTVSLFNVAASPLGAHLGVDVQACARDASVARHAAALRIRRRLAEDGYAAVIAAWAQAIAPVCDAREHARVEQLVALAASYEPRATLRTSAFVQLVETRRVEAGRSALVQAMTIHQSKGLGFDVVILPELESPLAGHGAPAAVAGRDGALGDVDIIVPWLRKEQRALFPKLEPIYAAHRTRVVQESLCLLYVAMTRAKRGLFALLDADAAGRDDHAPPPGTAAGVLRAALAPNRGAAPGAVLYRHGDDTWSDGLDTAEVAPTAAAPAAPIALAKPAGAIGRGAEPAAAGSGRRLADALVVQDADAIDRGVAMHALFERIEWLDDAPIGAAQPAAWLAHLQRRLPRRDEAWLAAVVADFVGSLDRAAVRELLTPDPLIPVEVWRERPFAQLARDIDGHVGGRVQQGAIDRLEVWRDAAKRVVGARVIDYKTDRVSASAAREHAAAYRPQLEAYRDVVARIYRLDPARVEMVVLLVEPGVAVTL